MKLRKTIFTVILLFVVLSLVYGGGGRQNTGTQTTPGGRTPLQIGMQPNAFVTDYKDNAFTRYMENYHNVEIDFYMLPGDAGEMRTKIALMVASNDLPDIFCVDAQLPPEQLLDYGSKGALAAMNRYLNDPAMAPNWAKIRQEDKNSMLPSMTQADGNIYSLPCFEPELWNETPNRYYINTVWLDKLGLKVPTTTAELRNVLIAFRDRDPNGNGIRDEIGLYGRFEGGYGENTISSILNSFIFYNRDQLALDSTGNRVIAPFIDPAFRRGLIYLNDLYRERVLAASLFTDDQTQFRAILNTFPNIVGVLSVGSLSHWVDQRNNVSFAEMYMMPPLVGPEGVNYTPYSPYVPAQRGMLTTKARNPEVAFKFLESFFDIHISRLARYGEEGVNWSTDPAELAKSTNAYVSMGIYPALTLVQDSVPWSSPSKAFWHMHNPRYYPVELGNTVGNSTVPFDPNDKISMGAVYNWQWYRGKYPEHILPDLKYTLDEAMRVGQIITDVNAYVRQSTAEFVTGARDINNDTVWNAYLNELTRMRLPQWITTAQAVYDRTRRR